MHDEPRHAGVFWTAKSVAAAAFFVFFLLIQTGIPLVRLWAPRPARFGWQMFSAKPPRPRFSLVLRDGTTRPAKLAPYVALSRGEVDLEQALPPHLCRMIPDLTAVQVTTPYAQQPRVFTCP